MNTRQMEIFVNIVRYGNFSNAAKKMFLSQPAISSNIDILEKELGTKLFIRLGRSVELTEKGRIFYEYCLKVLSLTEENLEAIISDTPLGGSISIISSYVPGLYLLPGFMKDFNEQTQQITYSAIVRNSKKALEGVLSMRYDLGLIGFEPENDGLVRKRIFTDQMVLITPKTPEYATLAETISIEQIKDMPFIIRSQGSGTLRLTEKIINGTEEISRDLKTTALNIVAEFENGEALMKGVAKGLGVSITSKICAINNPDVLMFNIEDFSTEREFYAIIANGGYIAPRVQRFFEFLPEV